MSSTARDPLKTEPKHSQLFQEIESIFEGTNLGPERWYIVTIAALAGSTDPELACQLYLHLMSQTKYSSKDSRHALVRRLREALIKSISIVGVCKPLEAILAIRDVEKEDDREYSFTRKDWKCDEANHERGMNWLRKVYTGNTDTTLDMFSAHKDFAWVSENITYGLYLSDRQILDDIDTEMVVLPAIMIQNLPKETHWHIRGTRRIGVSKKDVEATCQCVHLIAKHVGISLHKVPSVEDVEKDV